jgi:hypothetical protein
VFVFTTTVLSAAPPPTASPVLAREVMRMMENGSMDAFAATDPAQPDYFVAVLRFPTQLLVVSATHPSASVVAQRIGAGVYRDVYLDLQGTPTVKGKFFVQDAAADGLLAAIPGSGTVDVVYENGTTTTLFNGDFRGQHLSEAAYDARLLQADARYAHILMVLKSALEAQKSGEGAPPAAVAQTR